MENDSRMKHMRSMFIHKIFCYALFHPYICLRIRRDVYTLVRSTRTHTHTRARDTIDAFLNRDATCVLAWVAVCFVGLSVPAARERFVYMCVNCTKALFFCSAIDIVIEPAFGSSRRRSPMSNS